MRVRVVPYPPYRKDLGSEPIDLDLAEGSTLRDVLRALARRSRAMDEYARARSDEWLWGQLITHRDGEMLLLDESVCDGDCLELLPPIAGGTG